jgi:hypothetical protein
MVYFETETLDEKVAELRTGVTSLISSQRTNPGDGEKPESRTQMATSSYYSGREKIEKILPGDFRPDRRIRTQKPWNVDHLEDILPLPSRI